MFEIMNQNFKKLCEITSWKSILWHPQYLSETGGDFEMELPLEYAKYVKKDFYIVKDGSKKFGIIRTIEKTDNEDNEKLLKVSGDFGESILGYRVISCVNKTGPFYNLVNSILNQNFIEPVNTTRRIENFKFVDYEAFTDKISKQIVGANVAEALCAMCGYRGFGYELSINEARNGFDFRLLKGTDRSINQTENPQIIFSKEDFTLKDFSYVTSNKNYFTHVTVGGEGSGALRDFVTVPKQSTIENSGINRREVFLDASNISRTAGQEEVLSNADYYAALNTEGYTKLQESYIDEACEGTVENSKYELGVDYFFGDIITLYDDDLGIGYSTRVLGALYSYDENGTEEMSVEIGNMIYADFEDEEEEPVEEEDVEDETKTETVTRLGENIIPITFTSYGKGKVGKPTGFIQTFSNDHISINLSCFLTSNPSGSVGELEFELSEKQYELIYKALREELEALELPVFSGSENALESATFSFESAEKDSGKYKVVFMCNLSKELTDAIKFAATRFLPIEVEDTDILIQWEIGRDVPSDVIAALHTDGHLEVYGSGYAYAETWPWTDGEYSESVITFSCERGVKFENMDGFFLGCRKLTDIGDFTIPDEVTSTQSMFYSCNNLAYLPAGFTIPDAVTTTAQMFANCNSLVELPESFALGSGVTDAYGMFQKSGLTALPETFKFPEGIKWLTRMFENCTNLDVLPSTLTIPSTVSNMESFCSGCTNLWNIPTNFRLSLSAGNIKNIFAGCVKLTGSIIIDSWIPIAFQGAFTDTSKSASEPLVVNYTSACTTIDAIIATGEYIVKGSLVE